MNPRKLFMKTLAGPENLAFHDFIALAKAFAFRLDRINGSHHILWHPALNQQLNLQEIAGKAKPYQFRQFLEIVERHDLTLGEDT